MRRHEISDDHWNRIKDLLPGREGDPGVTAKDNRLFINAVLWIAKTGAPWRDLPERLGNWNSVYGGGSTAGPGRGCGNGFSGNSRTPIWNGSCLIALSLAPTSMLRAQKKGCRGRTRTTSVGPISRRFFHEDPLVRQWFGTARGNSLDSRSKGGCYPSRTSPGGLLTRSGYCGQGIRQRPTGQDGRNQRGRGDHSAQGESKAATEF